MCIRDRIYNVVYSDEKYEQDITDMLQSLQDYVQEEQVTELSLIHI